MQIEKFVKGLPEEDIFPRQLADEIAHIFDIEGAVLLDCGVFDHKRRIQIGFEKDGRTYICVYATGDTLLISMGLTAYLNIMKAAVLASMRRAELQDGK